MYTFGRITYNGYSVPSTYDAQLCGEINLQKNLSERPEADHEEIFGRVDASQNFEASRNYKIVIYATKESPKELSLQTPLLLE